MIVAAAAGCAAARAVAALLPFWHPIPAAAAVLSVFGVVYLALGHLLGLPEPAAFLARGPLSRFRRG
jgi:hypothetical protein